MKNFILITIISLCLIISGCKSTEILCDKSPSHDLCQIDSYTSETSKALADFESERYSKSFAIARTEDGVEVFGYSYGYKTYRKAQKVAMDSCTEKLLELNKSLTCYLIR